MKVFLLRILQRILQEIMKKVILRISAAWSMRRLSHRPIDPTTQHIILKIVGFQMQHKIVKKSSRNL